MSGRFSDYQITRWIDEIAALEAFGAVFYTNPLTVDPLSAEVTGPAYHRPPATLSRTSYHLLTSLDDWIWPSLPPGTHLAWAGIFDADTNGNLIAAAPLPTAIDLLSGGPFTLPAGEFVCGHDVSVGP